MPELGRAEPEPAVQPTFITGAWIARKLHGVDHPPTNAAALLRRAAAGKLRPCLKKPWCSWREHPTATGWPGSAALGCDPHSADFSARSFPYASQAAGQVATMVAYARENTLIPSVWRTEGGRGEVHAGLPPAAARMIQGAPPPARAGRPSRTRIGPARPTRRNRPRLQHRSGVPAAGTRCHAIMALRYGQRCRPCCWCRLVPSWWLPTRKRRSARSPRSPGRSSCSYRSGRRLS